MHKVTLKIIDDTSVHDKTHLILLCKNKIHTYTISTPRPSQVLTNMTLL